MTVIVTAGSVPIASAIDSNDHVLMEVDGATRRVPTSLFTPGASISNYTSRAGFVAAVAAGLSVASGTHVIADGLSYIYDGTTEIPDLPGFAPAGSASVVHFGAVGDSTAVGVGTNDTAAIQAALTWFGAANGRDIEFPGNGRVYRMSSGATVDLDENYVGKFIMNGPIRPDASAFDAITITNGRFGWFELYVDGGGQTADYTQADPTGASQAFVFQGVQESDFYVKAENYKGRVLRFKERAVGKTLKTVKNTFHRILSGDIIESARACGQAWFFDTNASAFGSVVSAITFWDDYGWVFQDCGDILIGQIDGGTNNNSGYEFRGCYSVWAGTLTNGDGTDSLDLYTFKDSPATAASCYNIAVDKFFVTQGANGVVLENIGDADENGISIGTLKGRNQSGWALKITNCRDVVALVDSRNGDGSVYMAGASTRGCDIVVKDSSSRLTSVEVTSTVGNGNKLKIRAHNGNRDSAATTPLVKIATTAQIDISGSDLESDLVNYLIDIPASNGVHWNYGRVNPSGASATTNNVPSFASKVDGYVTGQIGSTANGYYHRHDNGEMECYHTISLGARDTNGAGTFADPYRSNNVTWVFPSAFVAAPVVTANGLNASATAAVRSNAISFSSVSATQVLNVQATSFGAAGSDVITAHIMAHGRWR